MKGKSFLQLVWVDVYVKGSGGGISRRGIVEFLDLVFQGLAISN